MSKLNKNGIVNGNIISGNSAKIYKNDIVVNPNLVYGTDKAIIHSKWSLNGWGGSFTQYSTLEGIYRLQTNNGWSVAKYKLDSTYAGKTITISFWALKVGSETTSTSINKIWITNATGTNPYYTNDLFVVDDNGTGISGSTNLPPSDVWIKYSRSIVLNSDCQLGIGIYCHPEGSSLKTTYLIKQIKIEEGPDYTPWCPNENDEIYNKLNYGACSNLIEYDLTKWTNVKSDRVSVINNGSRNTITYNTLASGWELLYTPLSLTVGEYYTLSFDYAVLSAWNPYSSGSYGMYISTTNADGDNAMANTCIAKYTLSTSISNGHASLTFKATSTMLYAMINGGYINDGTQPKSFEFNNIKLEKGLYETDWISGENNQEYILKYKKPIEANDFYEI